MAIRQDHDRLLIIRPRMRIPREMSVLDWLKLGEEFLTQTQLASVRQMLKEGILREREAALARAAALDAQARAIDDVGGLVSQKKAEPTATANGAETKPLFPSFPTPEETTNYEAMSVAQTILAILSRHPDGIESVPLVQQVCDAKKTVRSSVYGPLTRMVETGAIRKRGDRAAARYFPKEIRAVS